MNLAKKFKFKDKSLDGFEEIIERLLELEKYNRTKINEDAFSDLNVLMKIATLETTLEYISKYREDKLYDEYIQSLEYLKQNE